jgi:hypothetical protein
MSQTQIADRKSEIENSEAIPQANLGNTVRASWNMSADDIRANIANYNAYAAEQWADENKSTKGTK